MYLFNMAVSDVVPGEFYFRNVFADRSVLTFIRPLHEVGQSFSRYHYHTHYYGDETKRQIIF